MVHFKNSFNNVADIILATPPVLTMANKTNYFQNLEANYTFTYTSKRRSNKLDEATQKSLIRWLNQRIQCNSYQSYLKLNIKINLGCGEPCYVLESKINKNSLLIGKPTQYTMNSLRTNKQLLCQLLNELYITKLIEHDSLLPIVDVILLDNKLVFLYEYCNKDLLKLIRYDFKLIQKEKFTFIKQLLLGLNYLHMRKITHRDLKIDNIYYCKKQLKITQFQSATIQSKSCSPQLIGSLPYLAPEILDSKDQVCPFKADVWSMGIIIFILVKGSFPWCLAQHKDKVYKRFNGLDFFLKQNIEPYLAHLLFHMLNPDSNDRFDTNQILQILDLHFVI